LEEAHLLGGDQIVQFLEAFLRFLCCLCRQHLFLGGTLGVTHEIDVLGRLKGRFVLDAGRFDDRDVVFAELFVEFVHFDVAVAVVVDLFEEVLNFLIGDVGVDVSNEYGEFFVAELFGVLEFEGLDEFGEVDVVGVDLEAEFCHYHFEFVFELFVELRVLFEVALEDWVDEDFVPGHPILFLLLQTLEKEIASVDP
jgi:hypothetical protein